MPIPNYAGKHRLSALFGPADYPGHVAYPHRVRIGESMPSGAVLLYSEVVLRRVLGAYRNRQVVLPGFVRFYEVEVPGGVIAVVAGFGVGGPAAARTMEDLVAAGARKVVSLGGAGALAPDLAIGDVVVCEAALRDEGVSYHYLSPESPYVTTSRDLTNAFHSEVERRVGSVRMGRSWTTDAIYRETKEEVCHYRSEGILTVEMEAASLASVAIHRRVEFATAFVIMDSLAEETWRPEGFGHPEAFAGLESLFAAAAAVLA